MTADDYTQPEIVRALARIEAGQTALGDKVDKLTERFVTADVFELRMAAAERDIRDAKASADSRRPSGWTIAVGLAAIIACAAALIPLLAK